MDPITGVKIGDCFGPAKDFPTVSVLLNVVLRNAMVIAGIIAFVAMVFAGFQVIRNAGTGDAQKTAQWQQALTAAVIGLVLIVSAYWIVQIIEYVTGVKILQGVTF